MSFGALLIHEYSAHGTTAPVVENNLESSSIPAHWQHQPTESFVVAPGLAFRLLRSLFTHDAGEPELHDSLRKLTQR